MLQLISQRTLYKHAQCYIILCMKDNSDHPLYVEGLHYIPAGAVKGGGKYACDIR